MTVGELDTLTPLRNNIDVLVPLGGITLEGFLSVPRRPQGMVLFAHGSGSSRHSRRNHYVADMLYQRRFATLLIDLLTAAEEKAEAQTRHMRFNILLLASRLYGITGWIKQHGTIGNLSLGLFGSSTGGGAALVMAAQYPETVKAVVSRGGRPDLAGKLLKKVEAPVFLIVGGEDHEVLRLNRIALEQLNEKSRLEIIPGATHLFEEPGALETIAGLAADWFEKHL